MCLSPELNFPVMSRRRRPHRPVFDGLDFTGQLVGPYLLTGILGEGSAGTVYRAFDTTVKRPTTFAIKCLEKNIPHQREIHLIREIILHQAVNGCPHVLQLREIIEEELYIFFVLDLCETDLFKAIFEQGVFWRNDALIRKAFIEILDGVSACHERDVYHRDLKPNNIMCRADGTDVKIGDFGLATHERICTDGPGGTSYYISPECWMSRVGDPYCTVENDIWALGIILFNMVTGRIPWKIALPLDGEFRAFLEDEDYLFHTSPISESLSVLLKWILHPTPANRLSISAIRQLILETDTFYKWDRPLPPLSKEVSEVFADSEQSSIEAGRFLDDGQRRDGV